MKSESEVAQLCPTLSDPMDCIACQAPPSMGFSRQEYWSGLPFPFLRGTLKVCLVGRVLNVVEEDLLCLLNNLGEFPEPETHSLSDSIGLDNFLIFSCL